MTAVAEPKIYRWDSDLLKQYSRGDLIALASSTEEARDKLRAGFNDWAREYRESEWAEAHGLWGEDIDTSGLDKLRKTFEEDLAAEPMIHETLWMSGSE